MVEWICFGVCVGAPLLVAAPFIAIALRNTHRSRGRWGDRLRVHPPGSDGPYREGETTERIPRRAPLAVWLTALLAPGWAIALLTFSPLAALSALGIVGGQCSDGGYDSPCRQPGAEAHVLLGLAIVALAGASLVLGIRLLRDSAALPGPGKAQAARNRTTALFGVIHQALLLAWWFANGISHDELELLPWIAVPFAIGMLVALVQWRASAHVERAIAAEAERAGAATAPAC